MKALARAWARVETFFLEPADPRPLAALRIGMATVLAAQAWALRHSILAFFSGGGLIQGELARAFATPGAPTLAPFVHWAASLHFTEADALGSRAWPILPP